MPTSVDLPADSPSPSQRGRRKLFVLLALVVVAVVLVFAVDVRAVFEEVTRAVEGLGVWGPLLFVAVYFVAAVLFVPASALTLAAGGLFGVALGSAYVSVASTLAATASFLIGRHLASDWISRKIDRHPKFKAIDRAVAEEGWKIVALTRLSPVFGFALLNYGYGLTKVRLRDYVLASWICMLPGTVVYVYAGAIGKAATEAGARTPGEWVVTGIGLAATIAVTLYITRLARRALRQRLEEDRDASNIERPTSNVED